MTSSITVFGPKLSGVDIKPYYSTSQPNLPISNFTIISNVYNKSRLIIHKRDSLAVYASSNKPERQSPLTPPSSSSFKGWIIGVVMGVVLPIMGSKHGALWEIKNRIDKAMQTVETIAEEVEKVAEEVDKIAEDIDNNLSAGKLKDLMDLVEEAAEKTAKTADSLDNIIHKVQETEEELVRVGESKAKEMAKTTPKKLDNQ